MILTTSSIKQLSMIAKINEPFKTCQYVVKKSCSRESRDAFTDFAMKSNCQSVFIHREYDGSERYMLLYPTGISIDMFPQDKSIIFLV